MKAWLIQPYGEDWCFIVHARTRSKAKKKGLGLIDEWNKIRAIRLPKLDGKIITNELLLASGFDYEWEGEPLDYRGYIMECGCDLCVESLKQHKEEQDVDNSEDGDQGHPS